MKAKFLMERASRLFAQAAALRSPRDRDELPRRDALRRRIPRDDDDLLSADPGRAQPRRAARGRGPGAGARVERGAFGGARRHARHLRGRHARRRSRLRARPPRRRLRQPRERAPAPAALAGGQPDPRRVLSSDRRNDESDRQMSVTTNLVHTNARLAAADGVAEGRRQGSSRGPARHWPQRVASTRSTRGCPPMPARCRQEGNAAEGAVFYRVALALEQARLRLDEQAKEGVALPREAEELAIADEDAQRAGRAVPRPPAPGRARLLRAEHACSPDASRGRGAPPRCSARCCRIPGAPPVPVPEPPNAAQLMAEAYNGAGRLLKALGRTQDAMREFQQAVDLTHKPGNPWRGERPPPATPISRATRAAAPPPTPSSRW